MIIGYTAGVFDMFHIGHLNILKRSRLQCDHLIVGVTTDELCLARKGKQPIVPKHERMEIVASIRYADQVVDQADMDKYLAWERYRYQRIFVGDDWKGHPDWNLLEDRLLAQGAEVVYLPHTDGISSTKLRNIYLKVV